MRSVVSALLGVAAGLATLVAFAAADDAAAGGAGTVTVLMRENSSLSLIPGGCVQISGPVGASVCDGGPGDGSSQQGVIVYDTGVPAIYTVQETVPPPGYQHNTVTYQCDATTDLLCVVEIGHAAAAVGGIVELPPLADAGSSSSAFPWVVLVAVTAMAALLAGGAALRRVRAD
jgi:hypothetical protein